MQGATRLFGEDSNDELTALWLQCTSVRLAESLEEAITCHAQRCFVASAMMIRKTLEEVCRDRGTDGGNLSALRRKNLPWGQNVAGAADVV